MISSTSFESYEHLDLCISYRNLNLRMVIIYRPPPSSENRLTVPMFFEEFSRHLEVLAVDVSTPLTVLGDFNFHMDNTSDHHAQKFHDLLDSMNFQQHVSGPTHRRSHTLDLVISRKIEHLVQDVHVSSEHYSDHQLITYKLDHLRPPLNDVNVTYRTFKDLDREKLSCDIADSFSNSLHAELDKMDLNELVSKYNTTLEQIYDDHAPV